MTALVETYRNRALHLVRRLGIARARDFTAAGIPLVYIKRLTNSGALFRLDRGLYQEFEPSGQHVEHALAQAARLVPTGVISLLSALRHHELTTQMPRDVWMTIPHKKRSPGASNLRLNVVRATGQAYTAGIEHVRIGQVDVPIYSVAKTVADCFKHQRQVGEDVAIEALRDALQQNMATPDQLMQFAAINRVTKKLEILLKALL